MAIGQQGVLTDRSGLNGELLGTRSRYPLKTLDVSLRSPSDPLGDHDTTYCRLCEVGCGLVAHIDDDRNLVDLRPDHDHPVTHGFACSNGLLAAEVHHDPARLRRPQRRTGDTFADVYVG